MRPDDYLKDGGKHCTITVDASPGADRTEIIGTNPWRKAVKIRVAAQARAGEANAELLRFLAEKLSIPVNDIKIIKGERSSLKTVRLPVAADKARKLLGGD
jgi:uncharacterized protein (TIGR00251 family)